MGTGGLLFFKRLLLLGKAFAACPHKRSIVACVEGHVLVFNMQNAPYDVI